jgi:hypothetical protein
LVLIEDVSVTGLDQDIVNAFEPRDEAGLCRMIAILGITTNAWDRMPDNQKQRATHQFEVGGATVENWASDCNDVAKFTARYLNAIRSTDEEIHAIAEDRFRDDIRHSRCDDCLWKEDCHAAFGYADFGNNVTVGMFPFSLNAPQAMLQNLTDSRYRSQRGLLDRILLPTLDQSFSSLISQDFPKPKFFAVQPPPIQFWNAGFLPQYCGSSSWTEEAKTRLRFLAQLWVAEKNTPEAMVAGLKPLLKPFGLPDISSKVVEKSAHLRPEPSLAVSDQATTQTPKPLVVDKELDRLHALLDRWHGGESLKEDSKFRDLLYRFLSNCIVWQNCLGIPITEKKRLVSGNAFPRIEDQTTSPRGNYYIDFPRNAETLELLQSLLMLSRSPSKTWNFPHGEVYKRSVARWLRKNKSRVIQSIQPEKPNIAMDSLRPAVQALALTALFRDRKQLPTDRAERVDSLFKPIWSAPTRPVVISSDLQTIVLDLEEKHGSLRDFVVQELGAGQGDANPKDFINPNPILAILEEFERTFSFDSPPEGAEFGYWKSRFVAVSNLRKGAFKTIPDRLDKERNSIAEAVQCVNSFVAAAGFESGNSRERLDRCLEELRSLIDLQRGSQHKKGLLEIPDEPFEMLWKERLIQDSSVRSSWGVAFEKASEVSITPNISNLIVFNPAKIKECRDALGIVEQHLDLIDKHLQDDMKTGGPGGDSRSLLLLVLRDIASLCEHSEKGNQNI